jgi:tRNA pseudouridine55 synthase
MIHGLAVVDKPAGMTSHDVVGRCRRIFGQKRVGHAGTLDPDATGVLLVGLGQVTRLMQWMTGLDKSYDGEIVLGVATSTLDAGGTVTGTWDMTGVTIDDARRVAAGLTGAIDQVPPMVSAIKIGGKRLHELARAGVEVDRPPRRVTVHRFELRPPRDADPGPLGGGPVLGVSVDCSSGTYIRSLAADLGAGLGGGAHLRALRRTAVGPWRVDDAVALDALGPADVLTPAAAVPGLECVGVAGERRTEVGHGRVLTRAALGGHGPGPWAVLDEDGALLAVYTAHRDDEAKPAVVLALGDGASGPTSGG